MRFIYLHPVLDWLHCLIWNNKEKGDVNTAVGNLQPAFSTGMLLIHIRTLHKKGIKVLHIQVLL